LENFPNLEKFRDEINVGAIQMHSLAYSETRAVEQEQDRPHRGWFGPSQRMMWAFVSRLQEAA
jgi:hypothetical protein